MFEKLPESFTTTGHPTARLMSRTEAFMGSRSVSLGSGMGIPGNIAERISPMWGQWVGSSIMSAPAFHAFSASSAASSGEKPARLAMTRASPSFARAMPSVNQ